MRLWGHAVKACADKHGVSLDVARTRTKILPLINCWPVNLSAEFYVVGAHELPRQLQSVHPGGRDGPAPKARDAVQQTTQRRVT